MATVILVGLTVVLVAAAAYVGLLLLRRSRPAAPGKPENPQTVGDLVRLRSASDDLSGDDLFVPTEARRKGGAPATDAPPAVPDPGAGTTEVAVPSAASRQPATPAGGVEVGDAPWRRAARMMGAEPGAGWETAPIPVVPAPATVGMERAAPGGHTPAAVPPRRSGSSVRADPDEPAPLNAAVPAVATIETAAPSDVAPAVPDARTPAVDPEPVPVPAVAAGADTDLAAGPAAEPDADGAPPEAPSRPLSDPDLTPLMGIPVIRALPVDVPAPAPAADPRPAAAIDPVPAVDDAPEILPVPPPRAPVRDDDEVVSMLPAATTTAPLPVVVSGSPQPVWFRVVRRDGEAVAAAVVALLDPRGREVDATKTATDGGGELRAPHGGHFLMVASADGFQPRAVILTVEEQPVELALLLPRSATLTGAVRDGADAVPGARVVARQEGEVVDEITTGPEGGYRFDDLAEGVYALTATDRRGTALAQVTLSEGTDLRLDLDLAPPGGAR